MTESHYKLARALGDIHYEIDTDKSRLDIAVIHRFLRDTHWAKDIPLPVLERAIANAVAFGLYRGERQIGFARVVTDYATFAYLADVFVLPDERGLGLGAWLVRAILAHPDLQGMRRWLLGTRDAHGLYRCSGFTDPPAPFSFLERLDPEVYAEAVPEPSGRRGTERAAQHAAY